ncbi:hypothetical protein [Sphingomonas sp.]|uniref:hypothetical protein n=1 Tax=Sphingomonas sp. TaxID=28214 RepID=UPI00286E31AC|nr:hypothetical protein [Sphingomonas sp.]
MSETPDERRRRLRWLTLGELLAVAAVAISALGLWNGWRNGRDEPQPKTVVVQKSQAIPLKLRGSAEDDGRVLKITPVEAGHALDSLVLKLAAPGQAIDVGSDGELAADDVEAALGDETRKGKGDARLPVTITARYVEAGADRTATGRYVLAYRWQSGGLLGGRSLRLTRLSRG